MHEAMAYEAFDMLPDGYSATIVLHATWCGIEVDPRWTMADDQALTCLTCVTRTLD